jgi:hypothetical protein
MLLFYSDLVLMQSRRVSVKLYALNAGEDTPCAFTHLVPLLLAYLACEQVLASPAAGQMASAFFHRRFVQRCGGYNQQRPRESTPHSNNGK